MNSLSFSGVYDEEEEVERTAIIKTVRPKKDLKPGEEGKEEEKKEEFKPIEATPFPTAPETFTSKKTSDEKRAGGTASNPFGGLSAFTNLN